MLRDSAHIQEFEAEWHNRKRKRSGEEEYQPLYTAADAEIILKHFQPYGYNQQIDICDGVKLRFTDAGHLLGSASLEIWIKENETNKKIVFSGDIGNNGQPLIKDPTYIAEANYVVMESTYGDRNHVVLPDYVKSLTRIIQETFAKGGNVVIPSFAVGRTQELLYFLREIVKDRTLKGLPEFSVYVDSPLAIEATNIFNKTVEGYYDKEAMSLVNQGINPISFPGLKLAITSDESKAINFDKSNKVIISASGMCEAGRIRHHLKHNLWKPECSIVFVGYQATGTLGRALLEGTKVVRIFGETIRVKAKIVKLEGMSAHADKEGLTKWINAYKNKPDHVFVVHGESSVCELFAKYLSDEYGYNAVAPNYMAIFDLASNSYIEHGIIQTVKDLQKTTDKKSTGVFDRLVAAGERLLTVIHSKKGVSNKNMANFADQINDLCEKWE